MKSIPPKEFAKLYPILQNARVGDCEFAEISKTAICTCHKDNVLCYKHPDCPLKKKELALTPEEIKIRYTYWNTKLGFGVNRNYTLLQVFCEKLDYATEELIRYDYLYSRIYECLKQLSFEFINAHAAKVINFNEGE